jgi:hypothetical protein
MESRIITNSQNNYEAQDGHRAVLFQCVVEGWSYEKREIAEAHVELQHGTTKYNAYLVQKQSLRYWVDDVDTSLKA